LLDDTKSLLGALQPSVPCNCNRACRHNAIKNWNVRQHADFLLRLGWLLLDGGVILGSNYVIFQQLGVNAPKGMLFFSCGR
jgi:hypothetical protein